MATGGLYGNASESVGLYGNTTNFGGSYFEWFIFYQSDTQPATPTGGSWSFVTNTGTPPTGWSAVPFSAPTLPVWVSIALVNSRSDVPLVWSAPGLFSYSSGLPILSGSGTPAVGDGINSQLYIQTSTTPQTIWFKQSGTWNRLVGSTLYADLTSAQTVAGIKTFSSPIVGSVTGTSENVTGVVAIANGGTSSTTASGARSALGVTATGQDTTYAYRANNLSDLASASTARTNLGLGSAAVLTAGAANGVATLDAGGTVPLSQIPASIQGGVSYQGTWNASTNSPTLTSSVGTKGYYYVVSTAGSTNLNGITSWNIGDWAIYNGTAWEKIDNTDAVTSVNGYTGTVVLTQPDIAGTASLTTVQTLTNKTLTSPIINEILDANGNEILGLSPTASATDFVTVKNGIGVAVPPHVYADGPSANIGLHLQPKGTGLITISDGTDFNKGIRFRSSGSAASAITLLDAVATAGRVVTLPDATTTLVGRDTTDTLTNKTIAFGSNTFSGSLAIANGGTGQTTANAAFNALVPSQTGNSGKYLTTNGTDTSWGTNPLGDVVGPASATANGIALFDGTTGKLLKDSAATDGLIYGVTVGRGAGASATNTALGASALAGNISGTYSVAIGANALAGQTSGGYNTAVGQNSMSAVVTGVGNSALGVNSMAGNTSGVNNTGLGGAALYTNSSGSSNTAVGSAALQNSTASNNTAVGFKANFNNETGAQLVAVGFNAGVGNTTGSYNIAIGDYALEKTTSGSGNIGIGSGALDYNILESNNTAIGYQAGYRNNAANNTFIGWSSGYYNQTGVSNVAVGSRAYAQSGTLASGSYNIAMGDGSLRSIQTGNNNVAVGHQASYKNTTGSDNVTSGTFALYQNTSGNYNTAFGSYALENNSTASTNTGLGFQAGYTNSTGPEFTAVGYKAGFYSTAGYNTFVGHQAGLNQSSGDSNTYVGRGITANAAAGATTGSNNTAIGNFALARLTSGANNVAIGAASMQFNNTGGNNVAVGLNSLYSNASSGSNVAIGQSAMYGLNSAAGGNIAIGDEAMFSVNQSAGTNIAIGLGALRGNSATGSGNIGIGQAALYPLTTGTANTIIGGYDGATTPAGRYIDSGSYNVGIGANTLANVTSGGYNTAVGTGAIANNNATHVTAVGFQAGFYAGSGTYNVFLGSYAGYQNGAGANNVYIGGAAGPNIYANATGSNNVGIGRESLAYTTSGSSNTALGYRAGYINTSGTTNTFIGVESGVNNVTGSGNTFVGRTSGLLSTGSYNCYVGQSQSSGYSSGYEMTTGSTNTILGGFSGNQHTLDIRTLSSKVVVSDGAGIPAFHNDSSLWTTNTNGNIDVTNISSTTNVLAITANTATGLFGGNNFSGVFIINDINQTGGVAICIEGGGSLQIISQAGAATYFVNNSSPSTNQIGVYMNGNTVTIKPNPNSGGTTNFRIIAFRTRIST